MDGPTANCIYRLHSVKLTEDTCDVYILHNVRLTEETWNVYSVMPIAETCVVHTLNMSLLSNNLGLDYIFFPEHILICCKFILYHNFAFFVVTLNLLSTIPITG